MMHNKTFLFFLILFTKAQLQALDVKLSDGESEQEEDYIEETPNFPEKEEKVYDTYTFPDSENNATRSKNRPDLTLIGFAKFNNGLGRITIGISNCYENLNYNFIQTQQSSLTNLSSKAFSIFSSNSGRQTPGKVAFLTDVISWKNLNNYKLVPNNSIKIAYSMFETTRISKNWVSILNNKFDLVVVPDDFLVRVYQNSGVRIPILVLPLGLYIEELLRSPEKKAAHKPFVFGCSAAFNQRKNHKLLVMAFIEEFKNSKNVMLRINGLPYGDNKIFSEIKELINKFKVSNIELTCKNMPWKEYMQFMSSLDCYVSLSKGEGYSIPPREAFSRGIPCILTNNTAQKTLCDTGFAKVINSIPNEEAYYEELFDKEKLGYFFNCSLKDVREALQEVYLNYPNYIKKAQKAKQWVKQYTWKNLEKKYINIVKPKKIILGQKNVVTNEYLMVNSISLFNKYKRVLSV